MSTSTFADDVCHDWARDTMHDIGGEALLVAHPPNSPGREAVIAAGLTALAEVEADVVAVGMRMGVWPMAADGWPLTAGYEIHGHIRSAHVHEAMAVAARALAEAAGGIDALPGVERALFGADVAPD